MNFETVKPSIQPATLNRAGDFASIFQRAATHVAVAPGRVNLIGEHTDYNLGLVLPMAIERRVEIHFAPRDDQTVRLHSANFQQESHFSLTEPITSDESAPWSNFVRGVADVLLKDGYQLNGLDGWIWGDVPLASGLSSSAAIEVASVLAFLQASEVSGTTPLDIARIAQRAEQDFVGVHCGLMDQFISAAAIEGHALIIRCDTMEFDAVRLPADAVVIVGDTKLSRSLAGSAYNRRRQECEEALRRIQENHASKQIQSMRDLTVELVNQSRPCLPDPLFQRVRHVTTENERVVEAAHAMRSNDLPRLGQLFNASHASLRDDYAVSSSGLDSMVTAMRETPGCYGARLTGAGFGGCAIALVAAEQREKFVGRLATAYFEATGIQCDVFQSRPSIGGRVFLLP